MSVADVPESLEDLSALICKTEAVATFLSVGLSEVFFGAGQDKNVARCDWLMGLLCDLLDQGVKLVSRVEGDIVHRPK